MFRVVYCKNDGLSNVMDNEVFRRRVPSWQSIKYTQIYVLFMDSFGFLTVTPKPLSVVPWKNYHWRPNKMPNNFYFGQNF